MTNLNTLDYESNAKEVLAQTTWDYYSSRAWAESTLQDGANAELVQNSTLRTELSL